MEIDIFCIAEYAKSDDTGMLDISRIFDVFSDYNFPSQHELFFVVSKIRLNDKESGTYKVEVVMFDPEGNSMGGATGEVEKRIPKGEFASQLLITEMKNTEFKIPGLHRIDLYINKDLIKSLPVFMLQIEKS